MNHGLYLTEAQIFNSNYLMCAERAQSVQGLASIWTVLGSNPDGGDIFASLEPTQPPMQWVPSLSLSLALSRGYSGRGETLTTHRHLAPRIKKVQSQASTPPLGLRGLRCTFYRYLFKLLINITNFNYAKILVPYISRIETKLKISHSFHVCNCSLTDNDLYV